MLGFCLIVNFHPQPCLQETFSTENSSRFFTNEYLWELSLQGQKDFFWGKLFLVPREMKIDNAQLLNALSLAGTSEYSKALKFFVLSHPVTLDRMNISKVITYGVKIRETRGRGWRCHVPNGVMGSGFKVDHREVKFCTWWAI